MQNSRQLPVTPHHLTQLAQAIEDAQVMLSEMVYRAREQQDALTWQDIADALSISRQAAWERFTQARLRPAARAGGRPLQLEQLPDMPPEASESPRKPGQPRSAGRKSSNGSQRPQQSAQAH